MGKAHQVGDLIGPNNLLFIQRNQEKRNKGLFQCPYCNRLFEAYISNVATGKTQSCGCVSKQLMGIQKRVDISGKKFSYLTAIEDIGTLNGHRLWKCQCDCGKFVNVTINNLKSGNTKSCGDTQKCPYAYQIKIEKQLPDLLGKTFGKLTVKERIIEDFTVKWKCQCDCGGIIFCSGKQLTSEGLSSCGCLQSKNESLINNILTKNNIKFETQKSFVDCVYKNKLCFDFYLPDYNCCIEYDGIQHFQPIPYFGGDKKFQETQIKDNIKNQYCKNNNIHLIRISYKDILSEQFLISQINNLATQEQTS